MWETPLAKHGFEAIQWGAVIVASLVAAWTDVRNRRIPNRLTGPVFIAGLLFAGWIAGWRGLLDALLGSLVVAVPHVLLFLVGGSAAGDAKLLGAIGSWLGVFNGLVVLFAVSLAGVVAAIAFAWKAGRVRTTMAGISRLMSGWMVSVFGSGSLSDIPRLAPQRGTGQRMPYGPAILAGVIAAAAGRYLWAR